MIHPADELLPAEMQLQLLADRMDYHYTRCAQNLQDRKYAALKQNATALYEYSLKLLTLQESLQNGIDAADFAHWYDRVDSAVFYKYGLRVSDLPAGPMWRYWQEGKSIAYMLQVVQNILDNPTLF